MIVLKTAGNSREAVDSEEGLEEDAFRTRELSEEGLKEERVCVEDEEGKVFVKISVLKIRGKMPRRRWMS